VRTPTAAELMQAWERGSEASAAARSLHLLSASCDELDGEALLHLPLGRHDALLLQMHTRLFGRRLDSVAACPACGAPVEAEFDAQALRLEEHEAQDGLSAALELHSSAHDVRVRFRLANGGDLIALQTCTDVAQARRLLIERCVIDIDGIDAGASAMPESLQAELAQAMAEADPQADLQLAFRCPDCAHDWQPTFDIAQFLWQELHAWALRMLRDIDTLARHYHWSEADILAMTPRRRQAYLEQCAS